MSDEIVQNSEATEHQAHHHAEQRTGQQPDEGIGSGHLGRSPHQIEVLGELLPDLRWWSQEVRLQIEELHHELPQRDEKHAEHGRRHDVARESRRS
ncbi:MAG: hypothetical protein EBY07_00065 [Actinobacteria bacterium]|nr:hypothetical protein [Actinomycetota bacterium]